VTRGTLQTEFRYRPFDELRRLGLQSGTETEARKPRPMAPVCWWCGTCNRAPPATGCWSRGDILVRVNGALVTRFEPLESVAR